MAFFGLGPARRAGTDAERLYGRADALALAADLLARDDADPRPVLVFTGPGGSGKTALLDGLESQLDQYVPYARVDCAVAGDGSVPKMLMALAFGLNRRHGPFGRLIFPRLVVGQLIMAQPKLADGVPAGGDGDEARAKVRQVLKAHRGPGRLRPFVQQLAATVLPAVGKPVPGIDVIAKVMPGLVFDLLTAGRFWRLDRYGSLDELVELNVRFHEYDTEANRKWVDRWLFEAFFAGLRTSYRRRLSPRRVFNCALLLDNADSVQSRRFLAEFAHAAQTVAHQDGPPPVNAIATSRRGVPDTRHQPLGQARAAYARRRPGQRWFAVTLSDLTPDEVGLMVHGLNRFEGRVPAMICQFTDGQPFATRRLLEAIPEDPKGRLDVGALLDAPDGDRGTTVGDRLFDGLLTGVSDHQRELLVTMSAARDQDEAGLLASRPGPLTTQDAAAIFTLDIWRDGGVHPPVLPPALHGLLRRRLAGRPATETADWETMHRRLRPDGAWDSLNDRDRIRDLYHALALGEVRSVTRRLADWLVELDGGTWLTRVKAVTAAPRRSPAGPDPARTAEDLARAIGPGEADAGRPDQRSLAKLVAGLWIAADPFTCAARQDLHLGIAAQYKTAAGFCREQEAELFQEARRHDLEAERWANQ